MPRVKTSQQFVGLHLAILYHQEVRKFAAKAAGKIHGKEEYLVLIRVAMTPYFFADAHWQAHVKSFGRIYARQPDEVLDFMRLVRNILSKWNRTQAGKVIKFCYEHRTAIVEERRRQYDNNGKLTAIIVRDKLWDKEKTIPVSNLPADEAEKMAFPKLVAVGSLLDKDLAKLLDVKTDSVKKARQEIARIDKEMAYWEHPAVVHYMKTGEITPELKRLQEARRKGKI
ncbi:MAG TPA: hypothetical protein VMD27_04705 [Candidatus Aquilonibacter sp.]|nr:hypothetical protein [Candidatus Aquilonibacter sp.]